MPAHRLCIVGGVAGGASCAARARRLSESAEIIIFEQGDHVSFANCGLPYYVGRVIKKESSLLVATPKLFRERFQIDVRCGHQVVGINPSEKTLTVKVLDTGDLVDQSYDSLVLSPGAAPVLPPIPGTDLPGVFTVWTIPDARNIHAWLNQHKCRHATVIGGGFIGLEMVDNLKRLGLDVALVDIASQVMPPLDPEMAALVHAHLRKEKVNLHLSTAATKISRLDNGLSVTLADGSTCATDIVVMAAGVRPRTELAEHAGIHIGNTGGIRVDTQMRTNHECIYAVGDVVEKTHAVSGDPAMVPLAGPANRQGRIAADSIFGIDGRQPVFRGVQATAVCGVLGMTMALTGLNANQIAQRATTEAVAAIHIHPDHHAGYYPGAHPICLKIHYTLKDGRILGAQAVGQKGVAKRIDVIATAIQFGGRVSDLSEVELCYAPAYGSAKDPVNVVGMAALNQMDGLTPVVHWPDRKGVQPFILDVRDLKEFKKDHVPDAVHIPLHELRNRISELPTDRQIWAHCAVGLRSHIAVRILRQAGLDARNISGGFRLYHAWREAMHGS